MATCTSGVGACMMHVCQAIASVKKSYKMYACEYLRDFSF